MNKGKILFADNDPTFLNTRSESLETAGYEVIKAAGLEEAKQLLKDTWVHLAVLDIRLVDDADDKDISGLTLAKEPAYRGVPKIIQTGFPTFEAVRESLGPALDGLPPAVSFIAKHEGVAALVQAVEQAFTSHVRLNWGQRLQWDEGQALSFPALVGLIEADLPSVCLPDRVGEIEDLFRKLLYEYDQVALSRLLWHKKGRRPASERIALEVFAYSQERGRTEGSHQFVVVCGRAQDVRAERDLYAEFAPQAPGAEGTVMKFAAETLRFAATASVIAGANIEEVQPFVTFYYRARRDKQIRSALEHLFQTTLAPWHQQGRFVEEGKSLPQFYRERLGLTEGTFPLAELRSKMQALSKEAFVRKLADIELLPGQLVIRFPSGRAISCPDPLPYLYDDAMLFDPLVVCGTTPGGLDVNTVLVDHAGRTWLTDFAQAGPTPIWHDFVSLETAIRFKLMEAGNLQILHYFEEQLLGISSLGEGIALDDVEPEHRRALNAIQTIRRMARNIAGRDLKPYYIGLLFCTLEGLKGYDSALRQADREVARLLYRLLLAAMLCEKIDQMKEKPPDSLYPPISKELRLDEANQEVWIGERRVALTKTQFDLLLYLYRHAGELCRHSDIVQEIFPKDESPGDEVSWLTTNIGRLRGKLGDRRYIVNVRGRGYKLVVRLE